MSQRREIDRRLATLGDVAEIMGALKNAAMVETVRLRRYVPAQQRVARTVEQATQDFLVHYPQALRAPEGAGRIFLVVGSERGFCGSYNEDLMAALQRERARGAEAEAVVVAVGRRLASRLSQRMPLAAVVEAPTVADEVQPAITRLIAALEGLPVVGGRPLPLVMSVLYHESAGHGSEVQVREPFRAFADQGLRFADPPRLYVDPLAFFRELTDHYLFAVLHELFYSALLAENERRLQHLEGALRRVDRTREELTLRGNALRQEEITEEIEIILLSTGLIAQQ
jgi:F-type H+-transporting ATPase subunit gamma